MHSRIFVVSEEIIDKEDVYGEWIDNPSYVHPSVDYVVKSETFTDDIKWLNDWLGTQVEVRDGIGIMSKQDITNMEITLSHKLEQRFNRIKAKVLSMDKLRTIFDFYEVAHIAWLELGFWYWVHDIAYLYNEIEILQYLKEINKSKGLYIIDSYDYHY